MRKKKENTFAIDIAIILSISCVSFVPHSITIAHFLPSFQRWTRSHTWILWTIVLLSRNCHSYIIATSVIQPPHPSREKYTRVRFREERTYEMDISLWNSFCALCLNFTITGMIPNAKILFYLTNFSTQIFLWRIWNGKFQFCQETLNIFAWNIFG